jgi:hypothetical protein
MSSQNGQQPNTDTGAFIVIPLLIVFLLAMIWMMHGEGLFYGSGKMAFYMLSPLDFIPAVHRYRHSIVVDIMASPAPEKVFEWVMAAWYLPSAAMGVLSLWLARKALKHPISTKVGGLRGSLSVDALMRFQARVHSPIAPIVSIAHLLHKGTDPRFHRPWHPHEIVQMYGLAKADGSLDRGKTEKYFLSHLGTRIYRPAIDRPDTIFPDRFNNYEKTIFAMLAPLAIKIKEGRGDYKKLMDALNYSAVNETQTPDLRLANELYAEYRAHPLLNNLFRYHHFSVTYLMQLYMLAKRSGKVTTADWVGWLRPNANALYAALNTAGRQTPFTESSGAFEHWRFEQRCRKEKLTPILPVVVGSVAALDAEWQFWRHADQRETEESLWGRMDKDSATTNQDLFRKSVTEILGSGAAMPAAGPETLFDQAEASARREAEDVWMSRMMAGVREAFPKEDEEGEGNE